MKTLLLDIRNWDLTLDVFGNIAVASNPYSLAQDAASAIKLFKGELWYNVIPGVPYWTQILGFAPPLALMKAKWQTAALTVPEIKASRCFITGIKNRVVTGQVQIRDKLTGEEAAVSF